MKTSWIWGTALVVGLTLDASEGRADVVMSPQWCPAGAVKRTSHAGPRCLPAPCTSDADCEEEGSTCRPYRVCTKRARVPPMGRGAFRPGAQPAEEDQVMGSCEVSVQCQGHEGRRPPTAGYFVEEVIRCAEGSFCVPPPPPPPILPPPEPTLPPPPGTRASKEPPPSSTGVEGSAASPGDGCSVAAGAPSWAPLVIGAALLVLVAARRRLG